MSPNPTRVFIVLDVVDVAVSSDPNEGSIISMKVRDGADISLWLLPGAMAKMQALLAEADMRHAKSNQPQ